MSNSNVNMIKNKDKKKYTVSEFCKKFTETNLDQVKEALIQNVMNPKYVSYEMKITICEKIIESSYYKKTNKNGVEVKKLHINSPAQYMLYCLNLVKQYTTIEVDFSKALEEFNLLNQHELLDVILSNVPEREMKEFRMILDMVENDTLQNEYESHAFISNQVERFGELFGVVAKPAFERLSEVLGDVDESTIDKIIEKLNSVNGRKGKFDIIK